LPLAPNLRHDAVIAKSYNFYGQSALD